MKKLTKKSKKVKQNNEKCFQVNIYKEYKIKLIWGKKDYNKVKAKIWTFYKIFLVIGW